MSNTSIPPPQEDYADAAKRCYKDGDTLHRNMCFPNACHLFGIGAECALKVPLQHRLGLSSMPHKHLPELRNNVLRTLSGRNYAGLRQLLNTNNYMSGWEIGNRYWPSSAFSEANSDLYRDHCKRTLIATQVWSSV